MEVGMEGGGGVLNILLGLQNKSQTWTKQHFTNTDVFVFKGNELKQTVWFRNDDIKLCNTHIAKDGEKCNICLPYMC